MSSVKHDAAVFIIVYMRHSRYFSLERESVVSIALLTCGCGHGTARERDGEREG